MQLRTMRMRNAAKAGVVSTTPISPIYPTCVANYNTRYLNLPEVQAAIHVDPSTINPKNNGSWKDCGGIDYDFNYESELPNYAAWTASKAYDILIYSGDADFILNHMGSINWITHGLNNSVVQPWRKVSSSVNFVFVCNLFCILNFFSVAHSFVFFVFCQWRGSDGQVAGYFEKYDGLTFLTVKGAGHFVPKDRPRHALDMLRSFLAGKAYDAVPKGVIPPPGLCTSSAHEL